MAYVFRRRSLRTHNRCKVFPLFEHEYNSSYHVAINLYRKSHKNMAMSYVDVSINKIFFPMIKFTITTSIRFFCTGMRRINR